jgi:hypothetical protein
MGLRVQGPRDGPSGKAGGSDFTRNFTAVTGRMTLLRRAPRLWTHAGVGVVEREYRLAEAGRVDGRGNGGQLQVAQDAGSHRKNDAGLGRGRKPRRSWLRGPAARGAPCADGRAPRAGGAKRAWRCGARMGWLVGERATRRQPEERHDSWSTLPASATLEAVVDVAHRRHAIEPCHEATTGARGRDRSQGRVWPGLPRHAVPVMRARSLLLGQAWRQRCAPPRRGAPARPVVPRGRIAGGVRCQPGSGRSPTGCVTKRGAGG